MSRYYPFPCNCCGECCKHIDVVSELRMFDRGDGVCKFLQRDNRCSIYSVRPSVCRGKFVYEEYFSHLSVKEFHDMMYKFCDRLREIL